MFIAEQELALEVGAPQPIGLMGSGQFGALGLIASSFAALDQAVAIEHGVDGADRRRLDHRVLADQLGADLRRLPGGIFLLDPKDRALGLERQLVGKPVGPAAAVVERV